MPEANRPRSATRSKSRSPAAAASAKPRSARRTRKQIMLDTVDDLRKMIVESCELPAGAPKTQTQAQARRKSLAASAVPTLVPYAGPAGANPFNSPPKMSAAPGAAPGAAPATMVPMTLGNAFKTPAKAKTPKAASAMPASQVAATVSKRKGVARPQQSRTVEGSYQWFIDDWVKKNPELAAGQTRPKLMQLEKMKKNYQLYKNAKKGSGAAAAPAAAPLSMLGEAEEEAEEDEEEEEEEEEAKRQNNLGLL